jgi:glutamate--cysteine ligase
MEAVVNRGRQPGLCLASADGDKPLQQWAGELLSAMQDIAQLMDAETGAECYSQSLGEQLAKIDDPELTPSARILREMREQQVPFFRLAMNYSLQWAEHFRARELPPELLAAFEAQSSRSLHDQAEIERSETLSFEQYLANFYAQYDSL